MAYEVRKTDGVLLTTVTDGSVDDTTASIAFIGKKYVDYGLIYNENQLYLLENFANTVPPLNPVAGQLWFDKTPGIEGIKVYINTTIGWRLLTYGVDFTDSQIDNDVVFNGEVSFSNDTEFDSVVTFNSEVTFTSSIDLGSAQIAGDPTFNGTPTFANTVQFAGPVVFLDDFSFGSDVTIDTLTVNDLTVNGFANFTLTDLDEFFNFNGRIFVSESLSCENLLIENQDFIPSAIDDYTRIYAYEQTGNDANTVLLLQFEGEHADTTFTDSSRGTISNGGVGPNNVIAASGNAALDLFRSKLDDGSLALDGTGDYLTITDNTNYDFGTNSFTMDGWIYTEIASTEQVIIAKGSGATNHSEIFINSSNALAFEWDDNSNSITLAGGRIETFKWHHWALERINSGSNSQFNLYLDGQRVDSDTGTAADFDFDDITGNVIIGRRGYSTFEYFDGNMDNIRIVKGEAKYQKGFTPRSSPNKNTFDLFFINPEQAIPLRFVYESDTW